MVGKITLNCDNCGSQFTRVKKWYNQSVKRKIQVHFCSRKCQGGWHSKSKRDEYSPFRILHTNSKRSSKTRGHTFHLTVQDIRDLWMAQQGLCKYSNIPMELVASSRCSKFIPQQASLDRIDSNKGYEKGNIQLICLFLNYGKNKFSDEQVKDFLKIIGVVAH